MDGPTCGQTRVLGQVRQPGGREALGACWPPVFALCCWSPSHVSLGAPSHPVRPRSTWGSGVCAPRLGPARAVQRLEGSCGHS